METQPDILVQSASENTEIDMNVRCLGKSINKIKKRVETNREELPRSKNIDRNGRGNKYPY